MIERLRQTYRHFRALPDEDLLRLLAPRERALVEDMPRADLRHALRTCAKLRASGADHELCTVGLLHDVGKPRGTRLWQRVAAVLAPPLARRFGGDTLRAYVDHAARGAEAARSLGLSDRAVRLIARHHESPESEEERALALADREDA